MQALVSIISDWKNHDYYLPLLKASVMHLVPDVKFFDVTHNIPAFSYQRAGFILRCTYKSLPRGTIHLVCVNTEASPDNPYVVIRHKSHYFVGTDNGVFGVIFDRAPETVVHVFPNEVDFPSFPCVSVYSKIAGFILQGGSIEELGTPAGDVHRKTGLSPSIEPGTITGHIMYVDSYNNGITNISRELFDKHIGSKDFNIYVNSNFNKVSRIYTAYNQVASGELVVLFNSMGLLEIAVRDDDAASLLNLDKKALITIKF